MKKTIVIIIGLCVSGWGFARLPYTWAEEAPGSIYEFKMKDIDGNIVSLDKYKGEVVLIVNVASKCGLTPQYEGLQKIYSRYKDKGFVILGFPANNFREQEPGTDAEIKEFCTLNYGVQFPMFAKISVKGADIHSLYRFLTEEKTNPGFSGEIRWNFDKFLFDRTGKPIARFHPKVEPEAPELLQTIEAALKK
jgi:glutathione peroxidase